MQDVSFEQCRAASSWSLPSHASMFTGDLPHQHRVNISGRDTFADLEDGEVFLDDLENHTKIGISANINVSTHTGFDSYFDEFYETSYRDLFIEGISTMNFSRELDERSNVKKKYIMDCLDDDHTLKSILNGLIFKFDLKAKFRDGLLPDIFDDTAKKVCKKAEKEVQDVDEPYFLFMNIMDGHSPHRHTIHYDRTIHEVPNNWSSTTKLDQWEINLSNDISAFETDLQYYRSLYAASIDYMDRRVSNLINTLQRNTNRETTVVITSDHGENLGFSSDRNLFMHSSSLSEGLLHTPLAIVNAPKGWKKYETRYMSQLELPTLLKGLSNSETPSVFADTIPAELGGIASRNLENIDKNHHQYWDRAIRCVYNENTKTLWDSEGNQIQYQLDPKRPNYQEEIADFNQEYVDSSEFFNISIDTFKEIINEGEIGDIDNATESLLKDLGYM